MYFATSDLKQKLVSLNKMNIISYNKYITKSVQVTI